MLIKTFTTSTCFLLLLDTALRNASSQRSSSSSIHRHGCSSNNNLGEALHEFSQRVTHMFQDDVLRNANALHRLFHFQTSSYGRRIQVGRRKLLGTRVNNNDRDVSSGLADSLIIRIVIINA